MKETNSLEARLKSWAPRRPSRGLERRLFGERLARCARPLFGQMCGWLAPATACLLFAITAMNHRDTTGLAVPSDHEELVAMSLSNQSYASFLPGSFQRAQNHWDFFRWTNGGGFNSSKHPFLPPGKKILREDE